MRLVHAVFAAKLHLDSTVDFVSAMEIEALDSHESPYSNDTGGGGSCGELTAAGTGGGGESHPCGRPALSGAVVSHRTGPVAWLRRVRTRGEERRCDRLCEVDGAR